MLAVLVLAVQKGVSMETQMQLDKQITVAMRALESRGSACRWKMWPMSID